MRSSDVDILIIPGLGGSEADHWQTRWEQKLSTARRVVQDDWDRPVLEAWRLGRVPMREYPAGSEGPQPLTGDAPQGPPA